MAALSAALRLAAQLWRLGQALAGLGVRHVTSALGFVRGFVAGWRWAARSSCRGPLLLPPPPPPSVVPLPLLQQRKVDHD